MCVWAPSQISSPALNAQRISSTLLCSFIRPFFPSFRPAHTPLTHSLGGGQVLQRVVCRYKRTDPISHTAEQQLPPQHTYKTLLCRVMGNCLILLQQWDFIAVSLSHTHYTECNTYCITYSTVQKGFSDAKRHLFT